MDGKLVMLAALMAGALVNDGAWALPPLATETSTCVVEPVTLGAT